MEEEPQAQRDLLTLGLTPPTEEMVRRAVALANAPSFGPEVVREDFLVDIALVFALLSFLAVVVASRLVIIRQRKRREDQRKKGRENGHDT